MNGTRLRSAGALALAACALCLSAVGAARAQAAQGKAGDAATSGQTTATRATLPPRAPVGGLNAIDATSDVRFLAAGAAPHTLRTTFVFPARARFWFGLSSDAPEARLMRFSCGDELYATPPGSTLSAPLSGADADEARMQIEMRRALLSWPHGDTWQRDGLVARASLGALGTLEARFADAAAPAPERLAFFAAPPAGAPATRPAAPVDEFRAIAWRKASDREKWWPASLELWHAGTHVWNETFGTIDVRTRWIDSFFVPPDRRTGVSGRPLEIGAVRALDLTEQRVRRVALTAGASWDDARREHARLAAEVADELKKNDLALDARATFEVDEAVRPTAVLLRLAATTKPLPEALARAYAATPEGPAFATFTQGLTTLTPSRLHAVQDALPPDGRGGVPYVRFDPAQPEGHVLLVVPLLPKDG